MRRLYLRPEPTGFQIRIAEGGVGMDIRVDTGQLAQLVAAVISGRSAALFEDPRLAPVPTVGVEKTDENPYLPKEYRDALQQVEAEQKRKADERERAQTFYDTYKSAMAVWNSAGELRPGDSVVMAMASRFHPGATLVVVDISPNKSLVSVALGAEERWVERRHIARVLGRRVA